MYGTAGGAAHNGTIVWAMIVLQNTNDTYIYGIQIPNVAALRPTTVAIIKLNDTLRSELLAMDDASSPPGVGAMVSHRGRRQQAPAPPLHSHTHTH